MASSQRNSGRGPGRPPAHEPIQLLPPDLISMSEKEEEQAIAILADLLQSWLTQVARDPFAERRSEDGRSSS